MSDRPLPEDLSRWPTSPYELLGVEPGADPRELKRAYTRLIRVYKPEQFPQEFQRIREAYEQALRFAELFREAVPPAPPAPASPSVPATAEAPGPSLGELADLWEAACEGAEQSAYDRLVELQRRFPTEPDVYLRLYWLLELAPERDPRRDAAHWLAEGLRLAGPDGRLVALYRRLWLDRPGEAVHERCTALLREPPCGWYSVAYAARWRVAALVGDWGCIDTDLEHLRVQTEADDEAAWVRYLLAATDAIAWLPALAADERVKRYTADARSRDHLSLPLAEAYDRLDHLTHLLTGWRNLGYDLGVAHELAPVLQAAWAGDPAESGPRLSVLADSLAREPRAWFDRLEPVWRRAPGAAGLLDDCLRGANFHREPPTPERPSDIVVRHTLAFLMPRPRPYRELRHTLLDYCLEEFLAPETVASIIADLDGRFWGMRDRVDEKIRADGVLNLVCRAHRLAWA